MQNITLTSDVQPTHAALADKRRPVHLETGDFGWFSCLWQSLINPVDDDVVVDLLAVAQAFQYIQSVSGETAQRSVYKHIYTNQ